MTDTPDSGRTAVIVEDDDELRLLLVDVLEAAGFSTVSVGNGLDGIQAVLTHQPLITTLDVNMPGIDGSEAARRIRAQSDTYIVMITAMGEEADVVLGLTAGADEYITKPFRPREFRARIDAMLRRGRAAAQTAPVPTQQSTGASFPSARTITAPAPSATKTTDVQPAGPATTDGRWLAHRNLRLDLDSRVLLMDDEEVDLTRTEFDLLAALVSRPGRVLQRETLLREVWQTDWEGSVRLVEAHMSNLRRKLQAAGLSNPEIKTVRGVGYRLVAA